MAETAPPWRNEVVAFNTALASTNKIHDDAVAREFGFRGGLVPGVDVWAYMASAVVRRWGGEFLDGGRMSARFAQPVYDGDRVVAEIDADGTVQLHDSNGDRCAEGRAWLSDEVAVPDVDLPSSPLVERPPPATPELLVPGTVLPTLEATFRQAQAQQYATEVRENLPTLASGEFAHPGWLARLCNTVLVAHVRLGPWIHVGTDAGFHHRIRADEPFQVRARVADEYERKGHRFVVLHVVISTGQTIAFTAEHTAIWRPRRLAAS